MHTPSAYTLTNTTRPSRIKRKIRGPGTARTCVRARALGRGRIGILAKEQTQVYNSDRNQRKQDTPTRSAARRLSGNASSLKNVTQIKAKLPWFRSVQPRALNHFSIHEHSCSYTLTRYTATEIQLIHYFAHLKHTCLHLTTHATDM